MMKLNRLKIMLAVSALLVTAGHYAVVSRSQAGAEPIHAVTPIAYKAAETGSPLLAVVNVDATKVLPADADALKNVLEKASAVVPSTPDSVAAARSLGAMGEWFCWGRLAEKRAGTSVTLTQKAAEKPDSPDAGEKPEPPLAVYAVTTSLGATAFLVNPSGQTLTVKFRFRMGAGSYEMEELRFSPPSVRILDTGQGDAPVPMNSIVSLIHLDGCDFASVRVAERQIALLPGEAVLIRTTNVVRLAVGAYYEASSRLLELRASAPKAANRLRKMLQAGEANLRSVPPTGNRRGKEQRLEAIHHLLLVTAQVQSLERNYLARHTVKEKEGVTIAAALERLSNALSQTSAVTLGLVPQITLKPGTNDSTANVAVSLRNGGTQSVDLVKLGLDGTTLPEGTSFTPPEPAYFGELRPGQSVETLFQLQARHGSEPFGFRCIADVSYLVASCPAHLRPRSQF